MIPRATERLPCSLSVSRQHLVNKANRAAQARIIRLWKDRPEAGGFTHPGEMQKRMEVYSARQLVEWIENVFRASFPFAFQTQKTFQKDLDLHSILRRPIIDC